MKNIKYQNSNLKLSVFGGEIFNIFEKACFRNGCHGWHGCFHISRGLGRGGAGREGMHSISYMTACAPSEDSDPLLLISLKTLPTATHGMPCED